MAYKDQRPLDEKLRELVRKPEADAIAWWKNRFEQIAAIPRPSARAGALIPELRELATLPKDQRLALTRARVLAFFQLAQEQKDAVFEARHLTAQQVPEIEAQDGAFVRDEVMPTLPSEIAERMRAAMSQAAGSKSS